MEKIDLKKVLRELYDTHAAASEPHFVEAPPIQFLMIDGTGDPNTGGEFQSAMGALYPVAYTVKFAAKELGWDFVVAPLEGLWWSDPPEAFATTPKDEWLWTVMIAVPDRVTKSMVDGAREQAVAKGKVDAGTAGRLRLEALEEGTAAQMLHIGPYADEASNIARLHAFVTDSGYRLRGKHHEIYMSDPRRVAPEKMKTIIRHPVEKRE